MKIITTESQWVAITGVKTKCDPVTRTGCNIFISTAKTGETGNKSEGRCYSSICTALLDQCRPYPMHSAKHNVNNENIINGKGTQSITEYVNE